MTPNKLAADCSHRAECRSKSPISHSKYRQTAWFTDPKWSVSVDTSRFWLQIALQNLLECESEHKTLMQFRDRDHPAAAQALEREFLSGMQSTVACAAALEAFCLMARDRAGITEKWKPPAYKRVVETMVRLFAVNENFSDDTEDSLRQLFRYRNDAMHPSGEYSAPVRHPDLDAATEWRFVFFRFTNANKAVAFTLYLVGQLVHAANDGFPKLIEYCSSITAGVESTLDAYESHFGCELFQRSSHSATRS